MLKVLHFYKTSHPDPYRGIWQVIFQLCEEIVCLQYRVHDIRPQSA